MKKIATLIFCVGIFAVFFTACASEIAEKGKTVPSDISSEEKEVSSEVLEENENKEVLTDISELTEWKDERDFSGGSYIWFGNFPKKECTIYDTNEERWQKILNANYETDDTAEIEGKKYVRLMNAEDSAYHYYEYEPVQWMVIKATKEKIVLFSKEALYNIEGKEIQEKGVTEYNWKRSILRSWLNGYGANENAEQKDCTNDNFIQSVFNTEEESVLVDTSGIEELNDANKDKVTLYYLSERDPASGWVMHNLQTNLCTVTDYANAVGVERTDTILSDESTCDWQIRMLDEDDNEEIMSQVSSSGTEGIMGLGTDISSFTVRPVICLDTQKVIDKELCVLEYKEKEVSEEEKEYQLEDWKQLHSIASIFDSDFEDYFMDLTDDIENPIKYSYDDIVELSREGDSMLNECAKSFLEEIEEKYGDPIEWKSKASKDQTLYLMYEFKGENTGVRAKIGDIFLERD